MALVGGFVVVVFVGAAILLATGYGDDSAAFEDVELGPVTSFEDIAGSTYQRQGAGPQFYLHFFEDGTVHISASRDLVEERPGGVTETRFEGTKIFLTETEGPCDDNPDAIYEIHLLENGNLEFVAIEDPCAARLSTWTVEWAAVP